MPWEPELFTGAALERVSAHHRRERLTLVPFFLGLMTGEVDAIVASFAGQPEVHHPIRGRVKGTAAFERFAAETNAWLAEHDVTVEDVGFIITPRRRVEEVVLHMDGRTELPVAVAADQDERGGIAELRVYFSGDHAVRPPLLQPDPALHEPDFLSAGELRALELCAMTDDGRACAVEHNAVTPDGPDARLAVYVRDDSGGLAAARIY